MSNAFEFVFALRIEQIPNYKSHVTGMADKVVGQIA